MTQARNTPLSYVVSGLTRLVIRPRPWMTSADCGESVCGQTSAVQIWVLKEGGALLLGILPYQYCPYYTGVIWPG